MATHSPQSRVVASRVNEIVGRLRELGHRMTPQRYAVVRALVEGGEHPSAEQLCHRVSKPGQLGWSSLGGDHRQHATLSGNWAHFSAISWGKSRK